MPGLLLAAALSLLPGSWETTFGQSQGTVPPLIGPSAAVLAGPDGRTFTLALPSGQLIVVTLPPELVGALPANLRFEILFNPAAVPPNAAAAGSLGGGDVIPLGPPIYLRLVVRDTTTGAETALAPDLLSLPVELRLPVLLDPPSPDQQFAWLREVQVSGLFAGYFRDLAQFDPASNALVSVVPAGALTDGTLFLPSLVVPAFVENFDPTVHIFSSPFSDGADFGLAAPQFTRYQVVGPQVAGRIDVFNPFTGNYGWIDAAGVGPVGAPPP